MRLLITAALMLLATGCTRDAETTRCDLEATHEVAFTADSAGDTVLAQSIGNGCDKVIGLFVVRTAEGYPVWSWSAPLSHRFGDVFAAEDREHVQTFLDAWAQAGVERTGAAPAWDGLSPGQTTLDQLTYNDIRARDLPMLCHFSGTARQTCVFWEPAAGGAGHLYDRDVDVEEVN